MRRPADSSAPRGLARRLAWFVGLWIAGAASLALIAWLIRLALV